MKGQRKIKIERKGGKEVGDEEHKEREREDE